jgi:prepilin-type N-terminal cleavage/methylation domain-containing protein
MKAFLHRLRRDDGFSMMEILVATAIMGLIAGITSVAIGTGFNLSAEIDTRAVTQVSSSRVIQGLTSNINLADPLDGVSSTSLSMIVSRNLICERHTYYVKTGVGLPSALWHKVQEIPIVTGTTCDTVTPTQWAGQGNTIDRLEIGNLQTSPTGDQVFSYYAQGGARIRVPGETGYDAAFDLLSACNIGRVTMTFALKDSVSDVKVIRTDAAPRAISMGGACQ